MSAPKNLLWDNFGAYQGMRVKLQTLKGVGKVGVKSATLVRSLFTLIVSFLSLLWSGGGVGISFTKF